MADKAIRLRALAAAGLEGAAEYHREHGGEEVALDFVDAARSAFALVTSAPGIGSLRYSYDLDIPGLRAWPIARFRHAIFYVATEDLVDVWRVLHTSRDIPETLRDPDD